MKPLQTVLCCCSKDDEQGSIPLSRPAASNPQSLSNPRPGSKTSKSPVMDSKLADAQTQISAKIATAPRSTKSKSPPTSSNEDGSSANVSSPPATVLGSGEIRPKLPPDPNNHRRAEQNETSASHAIDVQVSIILQTENDNIQAQPRHGTAVSTEGIRSPLTDHASNPSTSAPSTANIVPPQSNTSATVVSQPQPTVNADTKNHDAVWTEVWKKAHQLAQALKKMSEEDLECFRTLGTGTPNAPGAGSGHGIYTLDELHTNVKESKVRADEKRMSFTYKDKKYWVSSLIGGVLEGFERYAKVVDTCIQHSPEVTSLVWGGIQLVMQARHIITRREQELTGITSFRSIILNSSIRYPCLLTRFSSLLPTARRTLRRIRRFSMVEASDQLQLHRHSTRIKKTCFPSSVRKF